MERRFADQYFLHWATASEGRDDALAKPNPLIKALQCAGTAGELQKFLFGCYSSTFQKKNAVMIERFTQYCEGGELLVMHVTCARTVNLAKRSALSFAEGDERIRNILVIGRDETHYEFDIGSGILLVPASDNYEGLPGKVGAALHFIGFSGVVAPVLKVDDDRVCCDPHGLLTTLDLLGRIADYAGNVFDPTYLPGIDRTWHMGKCQLNGLNMRPYTLIPTFPYAQGPSYYLSLSAVHLLSKAYLMFEDYFNTALYEDLAVGEVLGHFSMSPLDYCLRKAGYLQDAG